MKQKKTSKEKLNPKNPKISEKWRHFEDHPTGWTSLGYPEDGVGTLNTTLGQGLDS